MCVVDSTADGATLIRDPQIDYFTYEFYEPGGPIFFSVPSDCTPHGL